VRALLAQAQASTELDREPVAALPDGRQVVLLSLGTRIEAAAANYRRARDPENARSTYTLSILTALRRHAGPAAGARHVADATLERLNEVIGQLNTALKDVVDLDHTHIDPDVPPEIPVAKLLPANALGAAIGVDNAGVCTPKATSSTSGFRCAALFHPSGPGKSRHLLGFHCHRRGGKP
jgi:hypothetical protein